MARTPLVPLATLATGLLLLGPACGDKDGTSVDDSGASDDGGGDAGGDGGGGTTYPDADEDGYTSDVDCDDEDPEVNPGATEICNGKDDDCDTATNEEGWIHIGEDYYDTIQQAIDAAETGDAVIVCSGTFNEQLTIDKTVSIISEAGAEYAILDGSGMSGSVVSITGGTAVLQGFSIVGGTGGDHLGTGELVGGGIYIKNTDETIIGETWISGNSATRGGGIFVDEGSSPMFQYVVVTENLAEEGAGVFANVAQATFGGSEITSNVAKIRGGGLSGVEGDFTINSSTVTANEATQGGGAAIVEDSSLQVTGSSWGEADSGYDNEPDDVWTQGGAYTEYGEGVTFSCTAAGCD